ncbi:MAG: hypothetical protein HRU03_06220 [Nanoarchaeales archaeon]|nr:hypothetical protein [Nanoarchaeales archaeon]
MLDINTYNDLIKFSDGFLLDLGDIFNYYQEIKESSYIISIIYSLNLSIETISFFLRKNPKEIETQINQTKIILKKFKLTYDIEKDKITLLSLRNTKLEK